MPHNYSVVAYLIQHKIINREQRLTCKIKNIYIVEMLVMYAYIETPGGHIVNLETIILLVSSPSLYAYDKRVALQQLL